MPLQTKYTELNGKTVLYLLMIKVNRIYLFSQFISSGSILLKSEFQWFGIEESLFNRKGRGEEWGMGKEEGQRGGMGGWAKRKGRGEELGDGQRGRAEGRADVLQG